MESILSCLTTTTKLNITETHFFQQNNHFWLILLHWLKVINSVKTCQPSPPSFYDDCTAKNLILTSILKIKQTEQVAHFILIESHMLLLNKKLS